MRLLNSSGCTYFWLSLSAMPRHQPVPTVRLGVPTASQASAARQVRRPASGRSNRGFIERHPRYKVMRDDVLTLSFPLSPELNQIVTIQPDGYISVGT